MGFNVIDGVRQKFMHYEQDTETGLDYAGARYHSPMQGRFTSIDPVMISARAINPQSGIVTLTFLTGPQLWLIPAERSRRAPTVAARQNPGIVLVITRAKTSRNMTAVSSLREMQLPQPKLREMATGILTTN
jgi:hypothetical protein